MLPENIKNARNNNIKWKNVKQRGHTQNITSETENSLPVCIMTFGTWSSAETISIKSTRLKTEFLCQIKVKVP